MPELLVEFLSEEIPARMQGAAISDGTRLLREKLKALRLTHGEISGYATPRRLAFVVPDLPSDQPDVSAERKGPRVDAPQKALDGFMAGTGLTLDQCVVREDKKGSYYIAVIEEQGRPTKSLLAELIGDLMADMPWPKSMRWNTTSVRWVRPLHNILAVFDGATVDGGIDLGDRDLAFSNRSYGHRFRAPAAFEVRAFEDYQTQLTMQFVHLDQTTRRDLIATDAVAAAEGAGLRLTEDDALLTEISGLVEWPTVLIADIDAQFMELPPEVMRAAMRNHQKYLSLTTPDGGTAPKFIFAANGVDKDSEAAVIAGNERVLRARLSDAQHFWSQDRKRSLADHATGLGDIVFHAKLGTVDQKIDRIEATAVYLADAIDGADKDRVRSAARLCKADLVTEMVGEFPELQGLVGRYYAAADGEHDDVARAVAEHYAPAGPNDMCPTAPVSVAVSLADKLDSLFWLWAYDIRPTGSKDPYALRRATLGIIRLVLENGLRLNLGDVFNHIRQTAAGEDSELSAVPASARVAEIIADLVGFFGDRLKVHLREQGVPHDHVSAVFAVPGEDDLVRIMARVQALSGFLGDADGANLLTAYRRAANILQQEGKKEATTYDGSAYDPSLAEGAEAALWTVLENAEKASLSLLEAEDFAGLMAQLAKLRQPVDAFFEDVTVNDEDPKLRLNRLRLLARIVAVMDGVAIFSAIEG